MIRPMFVTALALLSPCNLFQGEEPVAEPLPPGETCQATSDCDADRACVESRCRPIHTSVAGELLAATGRELFLGGDPIAAYESYREAMQAFERKDLPVPPEILCEAGEAAVIAGDHSVPRDQAARVVHECALVSLPGSSERAKALKALGRLRFDGLTPDRLDRETPADAYFTGKPARPSADAVQVSIEISDEKQQGWDEVKAQLESDLVRLAAVDCFMQAWEVNHGDSESASLEVKFRSRLRDMGAYDIYEGTPELTEIPGDGFGPCVSRVLASKLGDSIRVRRTTSWTMPVRVTARLR